MTSRISLCLATAALTLGCTQLDDPDTTAVGREIALPRVEPYVPGRTDPASLAPRDARYMQLTVTPGPDTRSRYAWGIGGGTVYYIYAVTTDDVPELEHDFVKVMMEREQLGASLGYGVAGTGNVGVPRPPTPPGEPPFSQAYAAAVVDGAIASENVTTTMADKLAELDR